MASTQRAMRSSSSAAGHAGLPGQVLAQQRVPADRGRDRRLHGLDVLDGQAARRGLRREVLPVGAPVEQRPGPLVAVQHQQRRQADRLGVAQARPEQARQPLAQRQPGRVDRVLRVQPRPVEQRRPQQRPPRPEVLVDQPAVDARLVGDLPQVEPGEDAAAPQQRDGRRAQRLLRPLPVACLAVLADRPRRRHPPCSRGGTATRTARLMPADRPPRR
ncbi:hypothetical protein LUX57_05265 [Actinomadura madurae]|nr:hypothetical protein [Actinomadura madurae]MCP9964636.1 hypothetical protein [Actinomadura madurae]